jgi:putative effector of murein hydrolase
LTEILTALFFILLTIIVFKFSLLVSKKFKIGFLNPLLLTAVIIIIILKIFNLTYSDYYKGGSIIVSALGPIVTVLALPIYKNKEALIKNFIPIIGGITASIITSFVSVTLLSRLFGIDETIFLSLLSKSITTPLAVEAAKMLGGYESVATISVIITGLIGSAVAPFIVKTGKIKNNIAKGIGIGSAAHAVGTIKAVEMNEETGAASGLAMGLVVGAKTVIIAMVHTQKGKPKILKKCTLPLTAKEQVDIIVTEMALIRVTKDGLVLEELGPEASVEDVVAATDANLIISPNLKRFGVEE